jgi:hypothetical protein
VAPATIALVHILVFTGTAHMLDERKLIDQDTTTGVEQGRSNERKVRQGFNNWEV